VIAHLGERRSKTGGKSEVADERKRYRGTADICHEKAGRFECRSREASV
jgi:hypothetical protein